MELDPNNYRAHTDLANLLISVRNPDGTPRPTLKQAKAHLDILRDKQPNNPETHQAWASYYAVQNNFDAAITEMDQAIRPIRTAPSLTCSAPSLNSEKTCPMPPRRISRLPPRSIPRP